MGDKIYEMEVAKGSMLSVQSKAILKEGGPIDPVEGHKSKAEYNKERGMKLSMQM